MSELARRTDVCGDWQSPVNRWQGAENSIHTDEVARRIGMRGGTIPGTVHLTHFRPILNDLFGNRWHQTGCISMYYTFATLHGEEVRAVVEAPDNTRDGVQLRASVESREGKTVCKGTVSVGQPRGVVSYVRSLTLEDAPPGRCRILAQMAPGAELPSHNDYVVDDGDEDGVVLDPQMMYRALAIAPQKLVAQPAVGFFGATEIKLHRGPIKAHSPYRKTGRIVSVGESPKTEFAWFDTFLHDSRGELVAEMRHMTRWMKASSPLWSTQHQGR